MALVLDETFTTMPPAFATLRNDGTAGSATWDGVNFAVNLVAGSSWLLYDITSQATRSTGEVEVVVEMTADAGSGVNTKLQGLWMATGSGAISNGCRFVHYRNTTVPLQDQWVQDMYNAPAAFGGGQYGGTTYWSGSAADNHDLSTGQKTLNMRWDINSAGRATVECRLNGTLVLITSSPVPGALRPCLAMYQSSMRLHSIKVWDAPQAPLGLVGLTNKAIYERVPSADWTVPQQDVGNPPARAYLPSNGAVDMTVPEQDTLNSPRSRGFSDTVLRKIMAPVEALTDTGQISRSLGLTLGRNTVGAVQSIAPGYPNAVYRGATIAVRNMYQGGSGRIGGTVKEKGSPDNNPVYRKVVLFDEQNMQLVRTAWSDKLTGAYSFDYVNEYHTYSVFAYDHTGGYRAVIANNQIPVIIT